MDIKDIIKHLYSLRSNKLYNKKSDIEYLTKNFAKIKLLILHVIDYLKKEIDNLIDSGKLDNNTKLVFLLYSEDLNDILALLDKEDKQDFLDLFDDIVETLKNIFDELEKEKL